MKEKMKNLVQFMACAAVLTTSAMAQEAQKTEMQPAPQTTQKTEVQLRNEAAALQTEERLIAFNTLNIQQDSAKLNAMLVAQRQRIQELEKQIAERNKENVRS